MKQCDLTISCYHGEMTQRERHERLCQFRGGVNPVMITTDVLVCDMR